MFHEINLFFLVLPLAELFIVDPDFSGDLPCPWSILEFIPFICMLYQPVCLRSKSQVKKILLSHWCISYFPPPSVCEILKAGLSTLLKRSPILNSITLICISINIYMISGVPMYENGIKLSRIIYATQLYKNIYINVPLLIKNIAKIISPTHPFFSKKLAFICIQVQTRIALCTCQLSNHDGPVSHAEGHREGHGSTPQVTGRVRQALIRSALVAFGFANLWTTLC